MSETVNITNAAENEVRQLSREEWERDKDRLHAEGWEAPEDEAGAREGT